MNSQFANVFGIGCGKSGGIVSSHSPLLTQTSAQTLVPKQLQELLKSIKILIVDDDYHMRKVVRAMLTALGVREIYDAADGMAGLQSICATSPDIVFLDWEMPNVGGLEFIRAVRSPGSFPAPNVPIIVLTGHGERSCVMDAMGAGANEYLLKPVSTKALYDRLVTVLTKPRPMVQIGDYYGPRPRTGRMGFMYTETSTGGNARVQNDQQEPAETKLRDDVVLI